MSKSLDFCKVVASDPDKSQYAYKDWSHAYEIESRSIFEGYFEEELDGETEVTVSGTDTNGNEFLCGVRITMNPDADFSYFTGATLVVHEENPPAELLYDMLEENISLCVERIMSAGTYDMAVGRPYYGSIVHYTIGNFVALGECDNENKRVEVTVLLPIKMNILREGIL